MVETLKVPLGTRSYDIIVGDGLLAQAGEHLAPLLKRPYVIIVTDENVARLFLHRLTGALEEKQIRARTIVLPAGEETKSYDTFAHLLDQILDQEPDRNTTLIALGGGVVGDITGFAASAVLRGIDFVQIPTTLLAQVDSSVGGKTGINTKHGKNLVGSFYQPKLVLIDTLTLSALPEREFRAGYAEVVKYGLINNAKFFEWCESKGWKLRGQSDLLTEAIVHSCKAKAAIVGADEKEQGMRALLNLGHTFAHVLEAETGFGDTLLHGEAVALGMVLAFQLSAQLDYCKEEDVERVRAHLQAMGLPTSPREIRQEWSADALLAHMYHDKKTKDGELTLILAKGIGKAFVAEKVDPAAIHSLLSSI